MPYFFAKDHNTEEFKDSPTIPAGSILVEDNTMTRFWQPYYNGVAIACRIYNIEKLLADGIIVGKTITDESN